MEWMEELMTGGEAEDEAEARTALEHNKSLSTLGLVAAGTVAEERVSTSRNRSRWILNLHCLSVHAHGIPPSTARL